MRRLGMRRTLPCPTLFCFALFCPALFLRPPYPALPCSRLPCPATVPACGLFALRLCGPSQDGQRAVGRGRTKRSDQGGGEPGRSFSSVDITEPKAVRRSRRCRRCVPTHQSKKPTEYNQWARSGRWNGQWLAERVLVSGFRPVPPGRAGFPVPDCRKSSGSRGLLPSNTPS